MNVPSAEPVQLRPQQVFAVEAILKTFEEGRRLAVLDAPTGAGKSVIIAEVARRTGQRVFVTTPQTSLVDQYLSDGRVRSIQPQIENVVGRRNYECERDAVGKRPPMKILTAAEATCFELTPEGGIMKDGEGHPISCRYKRWKGADLPTCPYYAAKARSEMSPFTVSTLAYFTLATAAYEAENPGPVEGWVEGRLSGRSLLFVDEAHGLEGEIIRFLTARFSDDRYDWPPFELAWSNWVTRGSAQAILNKPRPELAEIRPALVELYELMVPLVQQENDVPDDPDSKEARDELRGDVEKIGRVLQDLEDGIPWIVRFKTEDRRGREKVPVLELIPVIAAPHLKRLLWSRTENIVIASATFLDPRKDVVDLGLDGIPARLIRLVSEFPPTNGPVYRLPVASLNFKTIQMEFPKVVEAIGKVLEFEQGKRGVIHSQSFRLADLIQALIPPPLRSRLWVHTKERNRNDLVESFKNESQADAVLVSPSLTEGLDLPGDLGEFVIFPKAPFASREEDRVARRLEMPDGNDWYERQTLLKTVQGHGRILRSSSDMGRTYLLDRVHTNLLERRWFDLPPWFNDRMKVGDRDLIRMRGELGL